MVTLPISKFGPDPKIPPLRTFDFVPGNHRLVAAVLAIVAAGASPFGSWRGRVERADPKPGKGPDRQAEPRPDGQVE